MGMTAHTYNEMYIEMARDCQARLQRAQENFAVAKDRRKSAVEKGSHEELESQKQIQETLTIDLERLNNTLKDMLARIKEDDQTLLPIPIKYSCFNEDNIGIKFEEQNESKETFDTITRITKIFNHSVRAEMRDMRRTTKTERLAMAVNYVMNFEGNRIIKFMSASEFYEVRAAFIGKTGVSAMYGRVDGSGIQDIQRSNKKGIIIRIANNDIPVQEPIAVACDLGAIWKMSSGAFEWFWYSKEM